MVTRGCIGIGVGVGLMLGWAAACSPGAFVCQSDAQCVSSGVDGQCLEDGYCGFPDADCPSGLGYGSGSGALSGQCAPEQGGTTSGTTGPALSSSSDGGAESSTGLPVGASTTTGGTTTGGDDGRPVSTSTTDDTSGDVDSSSTGDLPADPSLVLWLTFDDRVDDGMWEDASGYDHHGICGACPEVSEGVDGTGVVFDGQSSYVEVPHSDLLSTPEGFTVAAWIFVEEPPMEHRAVVTKAVGDGVYNSWELYFLADGVDCPDCVLLSMAVGEIDETAESVQEIPLVQWVHVAGTWDGQIMTLWIDGQPVDEREVLELQMDEHPILVGADDDHDPEAPQGFVGFFDGLIDDVRLYDRRLDDEELAELAELAN